MYAGQRRSELLFTHQQTHERLLPLGDTLRMRGVSINTPPSVGWKVAGRDLHLPLYSTLSCCQQLKLAPWVANGSHFLRLTQFSGVWAQVKTRTVRQLRGVLSMPRFWLQPLAARRINAPLMRSSICHIMSHELKTGSGFLLNNGRCAGNPGLGAH